jgi:hypothetical protein
MTSTTDTIREELDALVKSGVKLLPKIAGEKRDISKFITGYHPWYTRALAVVRHLLPDRLADFQRLYHLEKRKMINSSTYTMEDYITGVDPDRFDFRAAAHNKFVTQIGILSSAMSRIDDILSHIQGVLQADIFDSEIETASYLHKNGHLRAAGAIAGVVLETHLGNVCEHHQIKIAKRNPTISDLNDLLRDKGVYDVATWRKIQHLGDLRNLCTHARRREPTPDEVQDMIDGVSKIIKTIS